MHTVFKYFVTAEKGMGYLNWFCSNFGADDFVDMDKYMFRYLEFCSNLAISPNKKFLGVFSETESKRVLKEDNIKFESLAAFDYREPAALEEASRIISMSAQEQFDIYMADSDVSTEFKAVAFEFIANRKKEAIRQLMADSFPKLSDGTDIDEVSATIAQRIASIDKRFSKSALDKLDIVERSGGIDTTNKRPILTTGIPAIDNDCGAYYSKQLITICGQPGGGKTRFAIATCAYRCAVIERKDVLIRSLELEKAEIMNMLIAIHIVNLYAGRVKIPDSLMNFNNLTPDQRRFYEAAKIDLFESEGKYGKIIIDDDDMCVETMESDLRNSLRCNTGVQCVVVDYLGFIKSNPQTKYAREKGITDIIETATPILKRVARDNDVLVIAICQLNREGIDAALAGKKLDSSCIQGGQAVERTTDYNLFMTATQEQFLAGQRTLSTGKVRAAQGFYGVPLRADLSVSNFKQLAKRSD